jgi:aspartate oxidase
MRWAVVAKGRGIAVSFEKDDSPEEFLEWWLWAGGEGF